MNLNKFVLIGKPLAKSASPLIYNYLHSKYQINSHYSRLSLQNIKHFKRIMKMLDIKGCNITMPYKQDCYHIAEIHDDYSLSTESTNTIKISDKYYGYNTDFIGFKHTMRQNNCDITRKQVLIIGAGNTAGTILRAIDGFENDIDIINRNPVNIEILKTHYSSIKFKHLNDLKTNYDIIINTIPDLKLFKFALSNISSRIIVDFDYISNELKNIIKNYDILIDGYQLLINQALYAFDIFNNQKYKLIATEYNQIYQELYELLNNRCNDINNILFNGFMGSGKSSIGYAIAEKMNMQFIDIDIEIEKNENMTISRIFHKFGESYFRQLESEMLSKLVDVSNCIIANSGGIIENNININLCKQIGYNILLLSDFDEIIKRIKNSDRPIANTLNNNELERLFNKRLDKYFLASDLIYYNSSSITDAVVHLIGEFQQK